MSAFDPLRTLLTGLAYRDAMKRNVLTAAVLVLLGLAASAGIVIKTKVDRQQQLDAGLSSLKSGMGPAAVRKLEPLANSGDRTAQEALGWIYAVGLGGVEKNDDQAIRWFRRAGPKGRELAEGEDAAAEHEYWVSLAYADGTDGADSNIAESRKWLERAARGGNRQAAELLRRMKPMPEAT